MNDVINRANLPSVLNGVTMSECDKVIEPFLEERSCDEVWHTVRALRDFYDWVMNENAVKPCKDDLIRRSDAIEVTWQEPSYTDAINALTEARERIKDIPAVEPKTKVIAQVTFDEDKLREIVYEAVERIKEEYDIVDGWILCSERLPEKDGDYLATLHCKWPDREYKTVEVEEFRSGGFDENLYVKVVAWMPLPEPWKGINNE